MFKTIMPARYKRAQFHTSLVGTVALVATLCSGSALAQDDVAALQAKLDAQEAQIASLEQEVSAAQGELAGANSRLAAAGQAFTMFELEASAAEIRTANVQAELDAANSRLAAAGQAFTMFELEASAADTRTANVQAELDAANSRLAAAGQAFTMFELEASAADTRTANVQAELDDANSRLAAAAQALSSYDLELSGIKSQAQSRSDAAVSLARTLEQRLNSNGVKGASVAVRGDDSVVIGISSASLFRSGRGNLSPNGQSVIGGVTSAIADLDNEIVVEGHTDNIGVGGDLAKIYPSNWELSVARAANAASFMQTGGIDPNRLSARGYGQYRPLASNNTASGRSANRRVDVILLLP